MGLPHGKLICAHVPPELIVRLDEATKGTKTKTRAKMIKYIIETWLDKEGY
jgi:predicted DNA-binding protein